MHILRENEKLGCSMVMQSAKPLSSQYFCNRTCLRILSLNEHDSSQAFLESENETGDPGTLAYELEFLRKFSEVSGTLTHP